MGQRKTYFKKVKVDFANSEEWTNEIKLKADYSGMGDFGNLYSVGKGKWIEEQPMLGTVISKYRQLFQEVWL